MYMNGCKVKRNSELSSYQKKVEGIDNVILCVAEAEKMVTEIGASLVSEIDASGEKANDCLKRRKFSWKSRAIG